MVSSLPCSCFCGPKGRRRELPPHGSTFGDHTGTLLWQQLPWAAWKRRVEIVHELWCTQCTRLRHRHPRGVFASVPAGPWHMRRCLRAHHAPFMLSCDGEAVGSPQPHMAMLTVTCTLLVTFGTIVSSYVLHCQLSWRDAASKVGM